MVFGFVKRLLGRDETSIEARLTHAKGLLKSHDDAAKGFSQLTALARENNVEAQFLVGECYLNGTGVPPNLVEGVRWMRRAAKKGWTKAAFILATLYLHGLPPEVEEPSGASSVFDEIKPPSDNREPDYRKAAYWAKIAADKGYADAQAMYGYVLSSGPDDLRDPEEGLVWYRKAADAGCVQGHLGLGLAALNIARTQDDYAAAAKELHQAAEGGLGTALYLIGVMRERGLGLPQDQTIAMQYYEQAAEKNVHAAQAKYGLGLMAGLGVKKNLARGETWLRRAALSGDAEAAAVLGDLYGHGVDLPPNYAEAVSWYRFASDHGHASASHTLGMLYQTGVGVPKDPEAAEYWFKLAAQQGNKDASADLGNLVLRDGDPAHVGEQVMASYRELAEKGDLLAAFNFGVCLAQGVGIEKNEEQALVWLKRAAEKVVNAQYWYGQMLVAGRGTDENLEEGRSWIQKASEAGMVDAQVTYADMLVRGEGGPKNHHLALELYEKAAESGNVAAMFSIGAMLGGGHDVTEDRVAAQQWFLKAAEKGSPAAQLMMGRYLANGLAGERDIEKARFWYRKAEEQNVFQASAELSALNMAEHYSPASVEA